MKLKAGDKVTIVSEPTYTMVEEMRKFLGKTVTVSGTNGFHFCIEGDEKGFIFTTEYVANRELDDQYYTLVSVYGIASAILTFATIAAIVSFASYAYCHGSNHNAHGAYCQAVYQDEYSALR